MSAGIIIAAIVASQVPANAAAARGRVCAHMRSHSGDSVQPPGIGMPGIDIDVQ